MKVKIFIIVVIVLAAFALMGIAIAGENISVSREEAEYLHQVFFSALKEEAEKKGKAIPEALSVDLIKIECDIRRFEGYNIKTKTLVATAYVRWAAGEKSGVFQVSETLRLAVGGLEISKEPISLQELSRIQRRIAEVLVLWLPA